MQRYGMLSIYATKQLVIFLSFVVFNFSLFHLFQNSCHGLYVQREVEDFVQLAVAVEDDVGGESLNAKVFFDGFLLVFGQVVVNHVLARHLILLDDVLPTLVATAVGEIEIDDVVVLQPLVFFLAV